MPLSELISSFSRPRNILLGLGHGVDGSVVLRMGDLRAVAGVVHKPGKF